MIAAGGPCSATNYDEPNANITNLTLSFHVLKITMTCMAKGILSHQLPTLCTLNPSMSCIQAVLQLCLSVQTISATFINICTAYCIQHGEWLRQCFWAVIQRYGLDRAPHVSAAYVGLCVRLLVTAFAHQLCDISCLLVSLKQCACQPSFCPPAYIITGALFAAGSIFV